MTLMADRKIAHELNNQLGVIVSFAELLLDELDAEYRHRGAIEAIDCAARRLMQLLDAGQPSETAADDLSVRCGSHLAIISRACNSVLSHVPATDPLAADVAEMLKAARAVETITASSPRLQLL
jgi:signal transduction histidine kinase